MRSFLLLLGAGLTAALSVKRAPVEDWNYHGCWTDEGSRQLGGESFAAGDMTPALCISFCDTKGYAFAGTEYSSECFCGHTIRSQSVKKDDTECNMPCSGESTKTCGGPNRLSIFTNSASSAVVTNPGPVASGWTHISCFEDSVYARALAVRIESPVPNTVDSCTSACHTGGYKFAGVEWSSECYCGSEILNGMTGGQTGCDMACSGNAFEYCGGSQRLNMYSFEAIPSSTSTTTESSSTTTTLSTTTPEPSTTTTTESSSSSSSTTTTNSTPTPEPSTTTTESSSSSTTTTPESTTPSTTSSTTTVTSTTTTSTTSSPTPEPTTTTTTSTTLATTLAPTTTTTTTTTTSSTTTVAPALATFALRGANSANPGINGKILLSRPTAGQVFYLITTQTAWVPASFSIEAGTNRLMVGTQYVGTNTGTTIYAVTPSMMGVNNWYVGCIGPARLGVPLQCFVETKTKTQFRAVGTSPNIYVALVDPTTAVTTALPTIDFLPDYV